MCLISEQNSYGSLKTVKLQVNSYSISKLVVLCKCCFVLRAMSLILRVFIATSKPADLRAADGNSFLIHVQSSKLLHCLAAG